jgi:hypothetical protein
MARAIFAFFRSIDACCGNLWHAAGQNRLLDHGI